MDGRVLAPEEYTISFMAERQSYVVSVTEGRGTFYAAAPSPAREIQIWTTGDKIIERRGNQKSVRKGGKLVAEERPVDEPWDKAKLGCKNGKIIFIAPAQS